MTQPNILDHQKFNLDLQKNQMEALSKQPGKNAHISGMLDDYRGGLRESGKGRSKNTWEYAMDGLTTGLSFGLKKADSDSYKKVQEYFDANLANLQSQNKSNMAKEQERLKMEPYAMTALQLMNGEMPYEQVNQQLGSIWQQAQLENPKLKGSFVSYIPNSDMINVRSDDGQVNVVPMASFVGADAYQKLRKDSLERQKLKLESDPNTIANKHKQAYIDDVNNRWDPNKQYDRNFSGEQAKKQADFVQEQEKRLQIIDNAESKLMNLKDLFESDKVISGKTLGAFAKRIFGAAFNTEGKSYTELMQAMTNGLYSFMKDGNAFGNVNMKEFELQTKQAPDEMNTPKGNLKIIEYQLKRLTEERSRTKHIVDSYQNYNTKNQKSEQQPISPENPLPLTPGEQQSAGKAQMPQQQQPKMVRMTAPDGTAILIPEANVGAAKAQGARLAE